jgi:simple sugar transport system ATP-binding protein
LVSLAQQFGFKINTDARVGTLSVGERQHVEILKVLYRDAKVLILDEPTAVLVPHEVEALFERLRKLASHGVSVIFISHKLREVIAIADRIVVLRRGRVVAERPIAGANPTELAELMVGQPVEKAMSCDMRETFGPEEPVLSVSNVTVKSSGGRALLDTVSLAVRRHEIVGVAGVAGNGQAALTDLLCGLVKPDGGTVELLGAPITQLSPLAFIDGNVARIPEDRHATGLYGDLMIWENVIAERYRTSDFALAGFQRIARAKAFSEKIIADFDVRCTGPEAVTRLLSGGNMQKLILGRTLSRGPRMVVANQPTRGLDVGAASYVHRRLIAARANGAGVLLISDDLDELLDLSDRVVVMYRGRLLESVSRHQININKLSMQMAGQDSQLN